MNGHVAHRISRAAAGLLVVLAVAAGLGIGAPRAPAYGAYMHGGIVTCATCHLDGHTRWKPVNEVCNTCHPGYAVPGASAMCWTCHTPGQDMSGFRSDAVCTAPCHLADGTTVTHVAHADRSATCTACHPLTASVTDAAGSPHHVSPPPPPPTIDGFLPAAAAVGDLVTVTGTGFAGAGAVGFNGTPATVFTVVSSVRITAVVPVGATSGAITVTTFAGVGTSAADLSVSAVIGAKLTLRAEAASVARGSTIRLSGRLTPLALAGSTIRLSVALQANDRWTTVRTFFVKTTPAGDYARAFRPWRKGRYQALAAIAATAAHPAAHSPAAGFTVR